MRLDRQTDRQALQKWTAREVFFKQTGRQTDRQIRTGTEERETGGDRQA